MSKFDVETEEVKNIILDIQKQIIKEGDKVVFTTRNNSGLKIGTVIKINPKTVRVKYGSKKYENECKYGYQIYIIEEHENTV